MCIIAGLFSFIIIYSEKPAVYFTVGLILICCIGSSYFIEIPLFSFSDLHVCVFFILGYLCFNQWKVQTESSNYFLGSVFLGGFIIFKEKYPYFFILTSFIAIFSFLFMQISPYLNKYLGLPDTGTFISKDQLLLRLHNLYYDPKYMVLIGFWKEIFPKRIAKGDGHIFSEVVSLVALSFSTMLHTRYRFLLPMFFIRCFLVGHPEWVLFYFVPVLFLTVLVYFPPYTTYIKTKYDENIFIQLGWNGGVTQSFLGLRTFLATGTASILGVKVDDYLSEVHINPAAKTRAWEAFHEGIRRWTDARSVYGEGSTDFPHKPTPPNNDALTNRGLRHDLPGFKKLSD